jgi:predicted AlkP superfamily pyrophosphatase or phosphodiesterase
VGYSFAASHDELINALSWSLHAGGKRVDFRDTYVPEDFQPLTTAFERAAEQGVHVRVVTQQKLYGTGLTRAAFRGGQFDGVFALGDIASKAVAALTTADRVFCYAYHPDLDFLGHVYGPGAPAWRYQLRQVDQLAASIAEGLPSDGMLVVTADHGMVRVAEDDRIDYDSTPELRDGVRMLGGEPRVRHVYVDSPDVYAVWTELLGDRAWVLTRDEAIDAGWFGPVVADHARPRIGDLVVAARANTAIVRTKVEPRMALLSGQHGSLMPDDQLIPLLVASPARAA